MPVQPLDHSDHMLDGSCHHGPPSAREVLIVPVGRRFADIVPEARQCVGGVPGRFDRLLVDGHAQRRRQRQHHAGRSRFSLDGDAERHVGWGQEVVVAGLVSGDRVERRGGVEDRPRQHRVGRCAQSDQPEVRPDRHATSARLQRDEAATRTGNPERPAEVAPVGDSDHARRHGCRASARRAAGREARVPGVARGPVTGVLRHRTHPELGRVALGDDDRARLAQSPHVGGVVVCDPVAERRAPVRRRQTLGSRQQILDGDRHAAQQTGIARRNDVRFIKRPLCANRDERVQRRVQALDSLKRCLHELSRRDLATTNELGLPNSAVLKRAVHDLTTYSELNGSWRSSCSTVAKPARSHSSCTRAEGRPQVPRPTPPCASDVVMQ